MLAQPVSRYSREGKQEIPLSDSEFALGMDTGHFVHKRHRAYPVLLYYTAVRMSEGLHATREQFTIKDDVLYYDAGPRLKKHKLMKICTCEQKNAKKAKFCNLCGKDISAILPTLISTKTMTTPSLPISLSLPYAEELRQVILNTQPGDRLFPYSRKTGYNITRRVWKYPHWFRLTRITDFLRDGYTALDVRSWTGLSLAAIEYYAGLVKLELMGKSMIHKSPGET
jgi:integrase